MSAEIVKRWIDAGKILSNDSNAEVLCPVCQSATLQVKDVRFEINSPMLERHMTCPSCGAYNALRLNRPQN